MSDSESRIELSGSTDSRWGDFLKMSVSVSHASGGALWKETQTGFSVVTQHQLGATPLDEVHQQWPGHEEALRGVVQTGQSQSLNANFEQASQENQLKLLIFPVLEGGQVIRVLELFLPHESLLSHSQIEQNLQQLLAWATPSQRGESTQAAVQFASWLTHIHQHLDLEAVCYSITNETRFWSGWDRVSLLVRQGTRLRLKSVSGVEALEPRSTTVKLLEDAAIAYQKTQQETLVSEGQQADSFLAEYHQRTSTEQTIFVPLKHSTGELIGLVVFDQFDGMSKERQSPKDLEIACHHIKSAIEHSLKYDFSVSGPLKRWRQLLQTRRLQPFVVVVGILFVGLFLCFWPATLSVTGTGVLEPKSQQNVYAGVNGLVEALHVNQGELVQENEDLLTLRSPELELETKRVEGELKTVRQQIDDLDKIRSDPRRTGNLKQSSAELAARAEELKTVEIGLQQQLELLKVQSEELVLKSPVSGKVISSNLASLLAKNRPVSRTDRLMRVADLNGKWKAEIHVDQRDIGPVLEAFKQKKTLLSFLTTDAPDVSKTAKLVAVEPVVTTDSLSGSTLIFEAEVEREEIPEVKPGTTILYRIDCGQASIGYVWFRRFIDRLQQWVHLL